MIFTSFATFFAISAAMRYTNPLMDVEEGYYEKNVNNTVVKVGDVVEVEVFIYWHGHVLPEFRRYVKVVDSFPKDSFMLVSGSNIYESKGKGGSYIFSYSLKVIGGASSSIELPKPILHLDNVKIPLNGISPIIQIS